MRFLAAGWLMPFADQNPPIPLRVSVARWRRLGGSGLDGWHRPVCLRLKWLKGYPA